MAEDEDPDVEDQMQEAQELVAQMNEHSRIMELLREGVASEFVHSLHDQLQALNNAEEALGGDAEQAASGESGQEAANGDESAQAASDGVDEIESSVETFLEFTGSSNRERALRYLIAADGQLDQAVNLFLSGSPLELLEPPPTSARLTRNAAAGGTGNGGNNSGNNSGASVLPSFLAQQMAGAGGRSPWVLQRAGALERGADGETAFLTLNGADLDEIVSNVPIGARASSAMQSNRILDDSQRAKAHVDSLRAGIWDKCPEIGGACLRSVENAERYFDLNVTSVVSECLPLAICAGEDGIAVRFLQLIECLLRVVADGHTAAVQHCEWWFIPARRSGSRRYARNSFIEIFLDRILPENDLEGLKQMWLGENFDPSWRDKKQEAEMLACALNAGCTIDMLVALVDPVNGCRANTNPEADRLGTLPSPLVLAGTAVGFDKLWRQKQQKQRESSAGSEGKRGDSADAASEAGEPPAEEREAWSRDAVEVLLDAGACIDEAAMQALPSMTSAARELILAEKEGVRVSVRLERRRAAQLELSPEHQERWWKEEAPKLFRALLRAVALTKHDSTMHRAMEVLALLVERFRPKPKSDAVLTLGKVEYEKFMQLLQSVFSPENEDATGLALAVRTIDALLRSTRAEDASASEGGVCDKQHVLGIHAQLCLSLCRFGIAARLQEIAEQRQIALPLEDVAAPSAGQVVEQIRACVVDGLGLSAETLSGRSAALLDVCTRLRAGDASVLEHLVWMMGQGERGNDDAGGHSLAEDEEGGSAAAAAAAAAAEEGREAHTGKAEADGSGSALKMFGDDGITAFEFEKSGLASALLHFLLGKDVSPAGDVEEVRRERMHMLLSAMPPPVVGREDAEMDDEEEVKAGEQQSREAALSHRDTEGGIDGDAQGDDLDDMDHDAKPDNDKGDESTLGRQASLTLESVQNLATTSLESIRGPGEGGSLDTAAFAASALYRLISKLQTVLSVHASHNFPVLAHDAAGGVRALVNPMRVRLRRDEELDRATTPFPDASSLAVQALPLTPLYEFQRHVLRGVRLSDPRYVKFCRKLVGRKVLHRLAVPFQQGPAEGGGGGAGSLASPCRPSPRTPLTSPGERSRRGSPSRAVSPVRDGGGGHSGQLKLALVLRYDPYTGAHLLQDLSSGGTGGIAAKGASSRVLNKKGTKQWYLMALREYQVLERVFDGPGPDEELPPMIEFPAAQAAAGGAAAESAASATSALCEHGEGSKVVVWWRGCAALGPGWREATVTAVDTTGEGAPRFTVAYSSGALLVDSVLRVGDLVRLIDDVDELKRLAQVNDGWTRDMPQFIGEVARVTTIRGEQVGTDGLGKYLYNIKALVKVAPSTTEEALMREEDVPQRRVFAPDAVPGMDDKHCFSVFLLPADKSPVAKAAGAAAKGDAKTDAKPSRAFTKNDRVEGRYAGKSRYYKGRIARVNADGTFDVTYDDGDSERGVKPHLICHIGEGPGKVVSFDFRKVFPNTAGRALFDALRRDDAVLGAEYNFVTRGFEHQPDFYATFSRTLEAGGAGVFAQFQTKQQADILFERVQRCTLSKTTTSSSRGYRSRVVGPAVPATAAKAPGAAEGGAAAEAEAKEDRIVHAMVDIFPNAPIPHVVEKDILAAFEQVRDRHGGNKRQDPPPPAGHRTQVRLRPEDFIAPPSRGDEGAAEEMHARVESEDRWISATILGKRPATPAPREGRALELVTCVVDDGRIIWDVPEARVRVAQRTSRAFPFKTKERGGDADADLEGGGGASPASEGEAPRSASHHDRSTEPVELSRQFTAFGQSTSYKRIRFSSTSQEEDEELGIETVDVDTDEAGYESDEAEMVPPRFEVDFLIYREPQDAGDDEVEGGEQRSASPHALTEQAASAPPADASMPILANQDGEVSMFQALFQLRNFDLEPTAERDAAPAAAGSSGAADGSQREYALKWRVRCVFPGDEGFERGSSTLRDKLPWSTPRALAFDISSGSGLTLESFCAQLEPIVPDFADWAARNKLRDITSYLAARPESTKATRAQLAVNWAAICAAYSQLCQRRYVSAGGEASPAVSPIRSPTLLKKEMLGIQMIGAEGFGAGLDEQKRGAEEGATAAGWGGQKGGLSVITRGTGSAVPDNALTQVNALLEECGIEDSVAGLRDTLLLLHLLYTELVPFDESADPLAAAFGKSLPWRNETLSDLLREQLSDPLSIATRCFPKWVAVFPREFSFLFRTKVRQIHLRCTALGVSRAVAWLQDEVTGYKAKKRQLAHVTLEISAMFRGVADMARYEHLQEMSDRLEDELKAIEQEHCIGQLHQDLVKVNRAELLHDAELLMRQHMRQRSELVVQFLDETGAGDGVTLDFYSSVSERLQLIEENQRTPMWVDSKNSAAAAAAAAVGAAGSPSGPTGSATTAGGDASGDDAKQLGDAEDDDVHIVSPGGLFPQPLLPLGEVRYAAGARAPQSLDPGGPLEINTQPPVPPEKGNTSLAKVVRDEEVAEGKEDARVESGERKARALEEGLRMAEERNARVVQRFRFLGRLMAKALLDGMSVPIPLSPEFFMLIQHRQRGTLDVLLPVSTLRLIEDLGPEGDEGEAGGGLGGASAVPPSSSGAGMVRRLFDLHQAGDLDGIRAILDELDLRFVDPSQPSLLGVDDAEDDDDGAAGSDDAARPAPAAAGSNAIARNLGADFERVSVPTKDASPAELLEFAEAASRLGRTQAQIDEALSAAGHPKLARWKAIKGSQKTRTTIALERAELAQQRRERGASMVAAELERGGATKRVTVSNVGQYLQLVLLWWLGHGVERQADAFCDGLRDVLGTQGRDALLFNFSHSELRRMLCGREEIQWKEDDPLLGFLVPMGDYTESSPSIRMLVEALKQMKMRERAQFLNFVTSLPRVPLSGLPQVKVYPPTMECIPGLVVRAQEDSPFHVGDRVMLAPDYAAYEDAEEGPLGPGQAGRVTSVEGRVRVNDWWYNPRALRLANLGDAEERPAPKTAAKEDWFRPGDMVRTAKVRAQVGAWDPETGTIRFHAATDMSARRLFKPGQAIEVVLDNEPDEGGRLQHPPLRVERVLEEPQPIQMRPYLRPKATTCAKTLYLPTDYDSAEHLLEVFRGAFQDAKLGGIHEA